MKMAQKSHKNDTKLHNNLTKKNGNYAKIIKLQKVKKEGRKIPQKVLQWHNNRTKMTHTGHIKRRKRHRNQTKAEQKIEGKRHKDR